MNRSARVAAQASDNQVMMSAAAWQRVVATLGLRLLQQQHEQAAAAAGGDDGDKDSDGAAVPWWRRGDFLSRQGTADSGGGGATGALSKSGGGGDVRAANGLLAAAELLMRTGSRGVDDEAAEAALSEATAAAAAIPELPSGQWLTGHSAGTFVLKVRRGWYCVACPVAVNRVSTGRTLRRLDRRQRGLSYALGTGTWDACAGQAASGCEQAVELQSGCV